MLPGSLVSTKQQRTDIPFDIMHNKTPGRFLKETSGGLFSIHGYASPFSFL